MKYQGLGVLQYEVRADVLPDCWSSWKRTVLSSSTGSTRTTAVATGRRKVRKAAMGGKLQCKMETNNCDGQTGLFRCSV